MSRALLLALLLLPGCATVHSLTHTTRRAPVRHAPAAKPVTAAAPAAAAAEPAAPVQKVVPAAAPAGPAQPGSSNPFMGFRPMRGPTGSGA